MREVLNSAELRLPIRAAEGEAQAYWTYGEAAGETLHIFSRYFADSLMTETTELKLGQENLWTKLNLPHLELPLPCLCHNSHSYLDDSHGLRP